MLLGACSTVPPQPELISVYVPTELRNPCLVQLRELQGLRDVTLPLGDYVLALECANGKLEAIDVILTDAESKAQRPL